MPLTYSPTDTLGTGQQMIRPVSVGVIGCGVISDTYLRNCANFKELKIAAVADLDLQRAQTKAREFGVPLACNVSELLSLPEVEVVLNLTVPNAHFEVSMAALLAGKSVYSEKPLATTRALGVELVEAAASHGVRLGCAPDTFLGSGLRTCRQLIDDGVIGDVVGAVAFRVNHGMEHWHANPAFFYQPGAGPLFDIGPYYLTALVTLLGPVVKVAGATNTGFAVRTITAGPAVGGNISVGTPTHVSSLLTFKSGAIASTINSFDVWHSELPRLEIYGTRGTLSAPDPNTYVGPVRLRLAAEENWREVPLLPSYADDLRGAGLLDMAQAIREGRPHRANGEMALHVLDIMQGVLESAEKAEYVKLTTMCDRSAPLLA